MLDLSGRHQNGAYRKAPDGTWRPKRPGDFDDHLDQRWTDHREVQDIPGFPFFDTPTYAMRHFMDAAGAVRFQPKVGFEVRAMAPPRQLAVALAAHFALTDEPCRVDVVVGGADAEGAVRAESREFPRPAPAPVVRFIAAALARPLD